MDKFAYMIALLMKDNESAIKIAVKTLDNLPILKIQRVTRNK